MGTYSEYLKDYMRAKEKLDDPDFQESEFYESTKNQLEREMKEIRRTAEYCEPGIGKLIKHLLDANSTEMMYFKRNIAVMGELYGDKRDAATEQEQKALDDQMAASEYYQDCKKIMKTFQYLMGLEVSKEDLLPEIGGNDLSYYEKIYNVGTKETKEKMKAAMEKGQKDIATGKPKYVSDKDFVNGPEFKPTEAYTKMKKHFEHEIKVIKKAAKDCEPEIQDAIRYVLNDSSEEMKEFERAMVTLGALFGQQKEGVTPEEQKENDDQMVKSLFYHNCEKIVDTMKYLVGMPLDKEKLRTNVAGNELGYYDDFRRTVVLNRQMEAFDQGNVERYQKGDRKAFSGNVAIGIKYPAVDPKNVFTEKEAEIKERVSRIYAMVQLCPRTVRENVDDFIYTKYFQGQMGQIHKDSEKLYKMSNDKGAYKRETEKFLNSDNVRKFERELMFLEHIAGIRQLDGDTIENIYKENTVPEMEEIKKNMEDPNKGYGTVAKPWNVGKLRVYFENADNMLTNIQAGVPAFKKLSQKVLEGTRIDNKAAMERMIPYFESTLNRYLDPAYSEFEKNSGLNRMDMIQIGGQSVRSLIIAAKGERWLENMDLQNEKDKREVDNLTALYVAAGLQSGKRVEAFIPQKDGKVSQYPMSMEMNGFEVKNMKKVEDGFFMWLLYVIGDFLHLTHRENEKKEYENTIQNRADICQKLAEKDLLDTTQAPREFENRMNGIEEEIEIDEDELTL